MFSVLRLVDLHSSSRSNSLLHRPHFRRRRQRFNSGAFGARLRCDLYLRHFASVVTQILFLSMVVFSPPLISLNYSEELMTDSLLV